LGTSELFTIEQFCKKLGEGRLMAGRCRKCGKIEFPPRPVCDGCYATDFEWVELSHKGRLLTYTIIHVAPQQFQAMAPYAVGIAEFEHGLKIPGMITDIAVEKLQIGIPLEIAFDPCPTPPGQWPQWPKYHFKPL
jgi:uncharacterized OB-fold protein